MDYNDVGNTRQFEPELSQTVYARMLEDEIVIGNYLHERSSLQITSQ